MPYADDISKLMTFNPYVETTPVETLKTAGMIRQQKYDDNLQRLQSAYQETKSLETQLPDKPGLKEYFNTKINSIKNSTREAITGDLSNQSLVSTIGGAIKNISNDNIIRKGLISSLNINNETKRMQEKIDKGESSPANEFVFQQQVSSYLQNPDLEQSFNGKYDPYFDVWKYAKDTFDAIKPGTMSWDEVYVKDPRTGGPLLDRNGQPTFSPIMMRHIKEGRDMSAVNAATSQIFSDPRVQKQLGIEGVYNYRNYNSESLLNDVKAIQDNALRKATNYEAFLNAEIATGDPKKRKENEEKLLKLQGQIEEEKLKFKPLFDAVYNNPDQVKQYLNKKRYEDNFTNIFGAQYESTKVEDNPGWKANMEKQKFEQQQRQFWAEFSQKAQFHEDDKKFKWADLEFRKTKEQKDELNKALKDVRFKAGNSSEYDALTNVVEEIDNVNNNLDNAKLDLLSLYYVPKQQNLTQEEKRQYVKKYIESSKIPESWVNNRIDEVVKNFNTYSGQNVANIHLKENYEQAQDRWNKISKQRNLLSDIYKDLPSTKPFDYITNEGKKINISQSDMIDLGLAFSPTASFFETSDQKKEKERAIERLKRSGKYKVYEELSKDPLTDVNLTQYTNQPLKSKLTTLNAAGEILGRNIESIFQGKGLSGVNSPFNRNIKGLASLTQVLNSLSSPTFKQKIENVKSELKKLYTDQSFVKSLYDGKLENQREVNEQLLKPMIAAFDLGKGDYKNESPDFKEFIESIGKEGNSPQVRVSEDGKVEIEMLDKDNKRIGAMDITQNKDMIDAVLPNLQNIRAIKPVKELMNYMSLSKDVSYDSQKYNYKIDDENLYKIGQSWMKKRNFPQVTNPNYDIQVNFKNQLGLLYPYVYINDKTKKGNSKILNFDPTQFVSPNDSIDQQAAKILIGLPQVINDTYINALLNNK